MRLFIALVLTLFFAALGAAGYWAYETYLVVFPALPQATYAGLLEPDQGDPIPFFVDSSRGPRDLWVAVGDAAMPAQRAKTADSSGATGLPLIITGSGARLRLTGDERGEGHLAGTFIDPIRNQRGRWVLRRISAAPISASESDALQAWAASYRELVQAGLDASQALPGAQKSSLAQGAQELQGELAREVAAFDQAARLTPQGELAQLSRDIVRREGRWIQEVLLRGSPDTTPGFERDLQRAQEVKGLLDQIAQERRALDAALHGEEDGPSGAPREPSEEGEASEEGEGEGESEEEGFYRDL